MEYEGEYLSKIVRKYVHGSEKMFLELHDTGSSTFFCLENERVVPDNADQTLYDLMCAGYLSNIDLLYSSKCDDDIVRKANEFVSSYNDENIVNPTAHTIFEYSESFLPSVEDKLKKEYMIDLDENYLDSKEIGLEYTPCIPVDGKEHTMQVKPALDFTEKLIRYLLYN